MNKVILQGRLVANPEMRQTQNGKQVVNFTVAVNRPFQKDATDFIRCQAWGKTAETIAKYVAKGDGIIVEGSWETGSYKDQSGNTVYTNTCNVSSFDFPLQKAQNKAQGYAQAQPNYGTAPVQQAPQAAPQQPQYGYAGPPPQEQLPF